MKVMKKPIVIDAWQITGNPKDYASNSPQWVMEHFAYPPYDFKYEWKSPTSIFARDTKLVIGVQTLEGFMEAKPMDYLMMGVEGELYICDREIFEKTYDILDEED